jgi:hypothetical protein
LLLVKGDNRGDRVLMNNGQLTMDNY